MASIQLELLDGEGKGSTKVLSGISLVGRDPACTVVVADRTVSREHAVITPEDGVGFVIEDLDSRSGTYVNGVRTRRAVLLHGDVIKIGPVRLRVRSEDHAGEVPVAEIEMVKTRHLPTTRLTLDAVKFRTSRRFLKDGVDAEAGGEGAEAQPGSSVPNPLGPTAGAAPLPTPTPVPAEPKPEDEVSHRLELLCDITSSLAAIHEPSRLTKETAARIAQMFPQARRIGFFELQEGEDEGEAVLRPAYLVDRSASGARPERVQVSHSVLQAAISERQALLSEDVSLDPRFKLSDSLSHAGVCSIVCVPLCLGERVLGALYVDTTDAGRPFDEGALRLLTGVAAILAAAFANARLFKQVQAETQRRESLQRYFSPDLVERILRGDQRLAREGRQARGTILFLDIRGFSRLTAITEPRTLVATLNAHFDTMQQVIFRCGGTVERFGGDSILAYWGIVEDDPQAPANAMRAALAMQREVFRLNPELEASGRPPLNVAVGLNSGEVIAGDVGNKQRFEFTIFGDAINMARRFESLARGFEVVAGIATIEALAGDVLHTPLPPTTVKGKDEPVEVSLVHGARDLTVAPPRLRFNLALPGSLDLGQGPEATFASGLELDRGHTLLEVLTPHDPEPGAPARLLLQLPRRQEPIRVAARVAGEAIQDTLLLGPQLMVAGSGVQRIRLHVGDPAALLASLGVRLG